MGVYCNYINYGEKFYTFFEDNGYFKSEENLFVFSDNRMKDIFSRKLGGFLFSKNPTFVTFDEFKERVFFTDKIVLKEAKRNLAFLKSIPEDIKEELEIKTYFDIIDFGNSFFSYYKQLNLSCNTEIEVPQNWQKKYLEYFVRIKENFDKLCKEYNYIPSDWLERFENFNDSWIKKYKLVVFIDIVEFPKLYKNIVYKMGETQDVSLVLQLDKEDFDAENLQLKRVKLPNLAEKPTVYSFNNNIESAFSLIKMLKNRDGNIYSPDVENNNFHELFPNNFQRSKRYTMNDTKLFKFLNIQYELLNTREEKLQDTYLLSGFLNAFSNKIFKDYYGIDNGDYMVLNNLGIEGYKYISLNMLDSKYCQEKIDWKSIEKIREVISDLKRVQEIDNLEALYKHVREILKLEKFLEEDFDNKDLLEKFLEIFGIIKSNESLKIYKNNREFLGERIGEGFYRLLIQYMKDIVIKSNVKSNLDIAIIKPFDFVRYAEHKEDITSYFIDVTDKYFPKGSYDKSIFMENQKKEMGIFTYEYLREIEKYRFFQSIASKKNVVIYTLKDEDNQIGISPFLEELVRENRIEIKKSPIKNESISGILNQAFLGEKALERGNLGTEFKKPEKYQEGEIAFGAYDINIIRRCSLKYYYSSLKVLDYIVPFEEKDLDLRTLGIVVHKVLEDIGKSLWLDVLNNRAIDVGIDMIVEKLEYEFFRDREKMFVHMDNYIKEILIPVLAKNIIKFFKVLNKEYKDVRVTRFQSERGNYETTPYYEGKAKVFLRGRADLVIEAEGKNRIIDYKTGNSTDGQLDYYSILLYGDELASKKDVYNVWTGKFIEADKVQLTKQDLNFIVKDFVENSKFETGSESECKSCGYQKICRRWINEGEDNIKG